MSRSVFTNVARDPWCGALESQRITGHSRHGLLTLALAGLVRSDIRAGRVFFHREDIERLSHERTPANRVVRRDNP